MNMDNLWLLLSLFFTLIFQVFIPGFPKETILLLNGANFGFFYGSILNWIGMILAAQVGYETLNGSVRFTKKYFELKSTTKIYLKYTQISTPALVYIYMYFLHQDVHEKRQNHSNDW